MSRRNRKNKTSRNLPRQSSQVPAPSESKPDGTILSRSLTVTQSYSGPLPPPEMFAKFDEVVPGSAKQIIDQFIKQGDHRMHLEKIVIEADVERSRWGLILGFVLALVIVLGSFYMIYLGKELIGSAGLLLAIGSLVGTFVYGTRSRRQEREAKEQMRQDTRKD